MFRVFGPAVFLLLIAAVPLRAAEVNQVETGFDLIPVNAAAGFAVPNLEELIAEGDVFLKNTGMEQEFGIRPSQLVRMAYGYLGVDKGRDDTIPAGIFVANLIEARVLNPSGFREIEKLLVVAVGVSDREEMAGNFVLAQGELKPEQIIKIDRGNRAFGKLIYLKDRHLYLGNNERAILSVARGRPLSQVLKKPQIQRFSRSDMLLHVGTTSWGAGWVQFVQKAKEHAQSLKDKEIDPDTGLGREMLNMLVDCLPAVQNVLFGAAIDKEGFEFQAMTVLRAGDHPAAEKLLALLRSGEEACSLDALPDHNLIAAQSVRSDGSQNRALMRAMIHSFLNLWGNKKKLIAVADRPKFVGLFDEVWQRLKGSKLAVYENNRPAEEGLFSMVAVLDADDPQEFLEEMRQLSRFAKPGELKLDGEDRRAKDVAAVKKLIEELGDADFRVRQSATLKLSLIGPPALPFLNEAVQSRDREIAARARRLKARIERTIEARRNDVVSQSLLGKVSARWGDFPNAETRQGVPIDIVKMDLEDDSKAVASRMQDAFGPEWSKIRLAVRGKKIVVLLGSNVDLLDQTLKNLATQKAGLPERLVLKEFHRRAPENRRGEFHVRLRQFLRFARGAKAETADSSKMTSLSLGIGAESVELHLWVPNDDFRTLRRF